MSSTPYKDELIRVIAALGLPDDTDITLVAEHVEDLQGQLSTATQQLAAARQDCAKAVTTRDQLVSYLASLRNDMRRMGNLVVANSLTAVLGKVRGS